MTRSWEEVRSAHDAAVAAFATTARAVAAAGDAWHAPRAEGKWSAAQLTDHLTLSFEAARRELREGVAMRVRTTAWQRVILRFTYQRRLMRSGIFPTGARAPREVRPPAPAEGVADKAGEPAETTITRFERAAAELTTEIEAMLRRSPGARFTHPYFGSIPLLDAAWISARHVDHHRRQLPGPPAGARGGGS